LQQSDNPGATLNAPANERELPTPHFRRVEVKPAWRETSRAESVAEYLLLLLW
jgi:hypothetical protein